jgi:hypothetical protein
VIELLALYLLSLIDTACAGYRAAAGRNALIGKAEYYRRSVGRAVLAGQLPVICIAAVAGWLVANSQVRFEELVSAAGWCLVVYLPYAVIVIAAFLLRMVPFVDLRSITSVLVFGPFLFARPLVAIAGVLLAVYKQPTWPIAMLGGTTLILMLSFEAVFSRLVYGAGSADLAVGSADNAIFKK